MRLDIGNFQVKRVMFGPATQYRDGVLTINKEEAAAVVNPNGKLKHVELHIACPGESCRILPIKAAVEPSARPDGRAAFPGYTGPVAQAGEGVRYNLKGTCVVAAGKYGGWMESVLDMSGPAADLTFYSKLTIIAFTAETVDPADDRGDTQKTNSDYRLGAHLLAEYLGRAVLGQTPDSWEHYELSECGGKGLPRILLCCMLSSFYNKCPGYNEAFYGQDVLYSLPTLIHPNELLDGAMTSSSLIPGSSHHHTYDYQELPMLKKFYAEHGRTIDFVGVASIMMGDCMERKEDYAIRVSTIAQLLRCDGAILCEQGGGNVDIDFFRALGNLEQAAVKTVGITAESPGRDGRTQSKTMLVDRADAIVSTGNNQQIMEFPAMDRVIGDPESVIRDTFPGFWADHPVYGPSLRPDGSMIGDTHSILGHDGTLGFSTKTCKTY